MFQPTANLLNANQVLNANQILNANQVLNTQVAVSAQPQDGNTPQQAELRAIWVLQLLAKQEESRKQYGTRHPLEVSEIGQKFFPKH